MEEEEKEWNQWRSCLLTGVEADSALGPLDPESEQFSVMP